MRSLYIFFLAFFLSTPAVGQSAYEEAQRIKILENISASIVTIKAKGKDKGPGYKEFSEFYGELMDKPMRKSKDDDELIFRGTGLIIDHARGLVLTPKHVIEDEESITVFDAQGNAYATEVVVSREAGHLAVIKIEMSSQMKTASLSREMPIVGQTTYAVGFSAPFSNRMATLGMVSAINMDVKDMPEDIFFIDNLTPANGFAGSPVLNRQGDVLGVVTAIYGRSFSHGSMTLVVPTAGLLPKINELLNETSKKPIRRMKR